MYLVEYFQKFFALPPKSTIPPHSPPSHTVVSVSLSVYPEKVTRLQSLPQFHAIIIIYRSSPNNLYIGSKHSSPSPHLLSVDYNMQRNAILMHCESRLTEQTLC